MNTDSPEQIIAEIEILLERRRIAQAKTRLSMALQRFPNNPELLFQAAFADYLDDNNEGARACLQQLLNQDPENVRARHLLFELEMENNNFSSAEQLIIQLLHDYPEEASFYGRYADLMIRTMNLQKARALSLEGLKYDPEDTACLLSHSLCDFIERPSNETSQSLQTLLRNDPKSIHTLTLVVAAKEDRGDHRGALLLAQELVRARPDNASLVEMAAEFTARTHWSMLPLWPMLRWGWSASIAIWLGSVAIIQILLRIMPAAAGIFAVIFLIYVVYSWAWPPLLRRWVIRS